MTMDAGVSAVEDADFAKGRVGEKGRAYLTYTYHTSWVTFAFYPTQVAYGDRLSMDAPKFFRID